MISLTTKRLFVRPNRFFLVANMSLSGGVQDEVMKSMLNATCSVGVATIFDKIISKQIKADIIYEDELCLAFRDINPQAPVHFLVIPKTRGGLSKLSGAVQDDKAILGHLLFTSQQVAKSQGLQGYR